MGQVLLLPSGLCAGWEYDVLKTKRMTIPNKAKSPTVSMFICVPMVDRAGGDFVNALIPMVYDFKLKSQYFSIYL